MNTKPDDPRLPWKPPPGAEDLFPPHPVLKNPWRPPDPAMADECAREGRHLWTTRLFDLEDAMCGRCGFRGAIPRAERAEVRRQLRRGRR